MRHAFTAYELSNKFTVPLSEEYPSYLTSWTTSITLKDGDTHFIYCHTDGCLMIVDDISYYLKQGMYACVPNKVSIHGGSGIVISREKLQAMFMIGGPVEKEGRLKYIDGCTDSLLIPPVMLGEPCLNLLYFPPNIDQTMHTHPSDRIGLIMSGKGRCIAVNDGVEQSIELVAGTMFCIHAEGHHKFQTPYGEDMRVLAYHPDSDFGPTHQNHPMLNRTMVDGVSANQLTDIQTK